MANLVNGYNRCPLYLRPILIQLAKMVFTSGCSRDHIWLEIGETQVKRITKRSWNLFQFATKCYEKMNRNDHDVAEFETTLQYFVDCELYESTSRLEDFKTGFIGGKGLQVIIITMIIVKG